MEGESSPIKSFETETRPPGGLLILLLIAGAGAVYPLVMGPGNGT